MSPRFLSLLLLSCIGLNAWSAPAGLAQVKADPRSTFPGRRVGGGTRGECTSRPLVHLVPESSVFASGYTRLLALLSGPSPDPRPLQLSFRPQAAAPSTDPTQLILPAAPDAAVILVSAPVVAGPTLWESSFLCAASQPHHHHAADPLAFADGVAPPAESLLLPQQDSTPADLAWQARLKQLQSRCGGTISRQELASAFGLADLLEGWPAQLPVHCPAS